MEDRNMNMLCYADDRVLIWWTAKTIYNDSKTKCMATSKTPLRLLEVVGKVVQR